MEKSKSARHSWKHQKVYLKAILREIGGGGGGGGGFLKERFLTFTLRDHEQIKKFVKDL